VDLYPSKSQGEIKLTGVEIFMFSYGWCFGVLFASVIFTGDKA
jgi:hypothetical protein